MSLARAIIVALAGAFLGLVLYAYLRSTEPVERVRPAPEFRLEGLDRSWWALSEERGKTVLVNFWATWCPPCLEETPSLEVLHRRLGPRGLKVVGVSVDEGWEPVRRFIAQTGVTYTVLLDPSGETPRRYGTVKFPETYLVNDAGQIVHKWVGAIDWTQPKVLAEIEPYLPPGK